MAHHGNSGWQRWARKAWRSNARPASMGLRSLAWDPADLLNNHQKFRDQSLQLTSSSQLRFLTFLFCELHYIFLRTGHINHQRSMYVLETVSCGLGFFNKRNAHNIATRLKRALPGARNSQSLSVVITL